MIDTRIIGKLPVYTVKFVKRKFILLFKFYISRLFSFRHACRIGYRLSFTYFFETCVCVIIWDHSMSIHCSFDSKSSLDGKWLRYVVCYREIYKYNFKENVIVLCLFFNKAKILLIKFTQFLLFFFWKEKGEKIESFIEKRKAR